MNIEMMRLHMMNLQNSEVGQFKTLSEQSH